MDAIDFDVVLVGCGNMGSALVEGAVKSGVVDPARLELRDPNASRRRSLAERCGSDLTFVATGPALVILAVKPTQIEEVIDAYDGSEDDILVSVAAGVSTRVLLEGWTDHVVRAMPNTPALEGEGMTGLYFVADAYPEVLAFFEAVGKIAVLESEDQFHALTAISGSGPAYVFQAIEALADGGVKMGLGRELSIRLAVQTFKGASVMAQSSDVHTAELKDRVASPGGTTIAALTTLDAHGFRAALIAAVEAAANRSRSMGE